MADPPNMYTQPPDPGLRCPRCGHALVRMRRKLFDRLLSLVSPRRRYRCRAMGCGWEGTLRLKH
jgi:hypothetical protein